MIQSTLELKSVIERLAASGMPLPQATEKACLFAAVAHRMQSRGIDPIASSHSFYIPGRIEFLGKHTDYAGGRSLICAVNRGFCITAVPRADLLVRIFGETESADVSFNLNPDLTPVIGHWSNYPMTVARRVARNFPGDLLGADIAFVSDLPASSGLSSSSALMISFFLCFAKINRLKERAEYLDNITTSTDLAGYLGTIENGRTFGTLAGDRGVGTFGGSEDHTAILTARPGALSQYSFCPVVHERQIALPMDHTLVIGVSGVIAEKTGSALQAYNNASLSARAVLEHWRKSSGRNDATLAAAITALDGHAEVIRRSLPSEDMMDRFNQFVAESTEIIPAAGDALIAGRLGELGQLVDRSQNLAEHLLKNQVPETIYLAKSARECGAVAASAFGAGFGGSVWALVPDATLDSFLVRWRERYQTEFPAASERAAFFAAAAGVPAMELS